MLGGISSSDAYIYDVANRLASVDGVNYTWDANGNLLNDGANTYTYDSANRLTSVNGTTNYSYNGLGDRLSQSVDGVPTNYTLDLNAGLTQVLTDGTNTYTYGLGRISQEQSGNDPEYFLGDALGSVRQLTSPSGQVTYAKSYDPYGVVTQVSGEGQSAYGYTGESQDVANGMVYLRSRYYNVADGRFLSRDTWGGDYYLPITLNRWAYANANPANLVDLSGRAAGLLDQNGYSEGMIMAFTGFFMNLVVSGNELVYDFETLERAKFFITARIDPSTGKEKWIAGGCSSIVNITGATYTSGIFGFNHDGGIAEDYGGQSISVGGGFSLIIPGAGAIAFSSVDTGTNTPNWDVFGLSSYQELGVDISAMALILEGGGMITEYHLAGDVKLYNNIDEMAQDIMKGEESPIHTHIGLKTLREWAAEQAKHYREIRE
jgi:RHS repeat-associated protein